MTSDEIKNFLAALDVTISGDSSGWLQIFELESISLGASGNQFLNPFCSRLNFDFKNNLIKIKNYNAKQISMNLNSQSHSDEDGKIILKRFNGLYTEKKFYSPIFVNPRKIQDGDYLYLVDFYGKKVNETKIKKIEFFPESAEIEIEDPNDFKLEKNSGKTLVYALKEFYNDSGTLLYPKDNCLMINYTEKTNNAVDIYIDFDSVISFSLFAGK